MHISRIQTLFAGEGYSTGRSEVAPENILKTPVLERFIARIERLLGRALQSAFHLPEPVKVDLIPPRCVVRYPGNATALAQGLDARYVYHDCRSGQETLTLPLRSLFLSLAQGPEGAAVRTKSQRILETYQIAQRTFDKNSPI
ncbi:MAG TPA: hypothetical protein PKX87_07710 [Alphaproteobacteria bacterium]|nr:hypothetical protein [Alphaproteobacteria bacterium]